VTVAWEYDAFADRLEAEASRKQNRAQPLRGHSRSVRSVLGGQGE